MLNTSPSADRERSYSGGYMALGKQGEKAVIDWLRNHERVSNVRNVTDEKVFQDMEIDVTFELDGVERTGEIKTDKHLGVTDNVLVEVLRINHTAPVEHAMTPGWFIRSAADYLFYYAISVQKIYYGRLDDLRKAFQAYSQKARKNMRTNIVDTDKIKTTINILVPFDAFKNVLKERSI